MRVLLDVVLAAALVTALWALGYAALGRTGRMERAVIVSINAPVALAAAAWLAWEIT